MAKKLLVWCVGVGNCFTLLCAAVFPSWRDQQFKEAVARGDAARVTALLQQGADPNTDVCTHTNSVIWFDWLPVTIQPQKCAGSSPLLLAATRANKPKTPLVVEALLRHGAKVHATMPTYGETALDIAVRREDLATAQVLLSYGAGSNKNDLNKALAETSGYINNACITNTPMFRLLFSQRKDTLSNEDKTEWLWNRAGWGDRETIDFLLEQEVNIDAQGVGGQTALMKAARYDSTKAVEILLNHGANPNAQDNDGKTALHYALQAIINNAYFDKKHNRQIGLHLTEQITSPFKQHGAAFDRKDKKGQTPNDLLKTVRAKLR